MSSIPSPRTSSAVRMQGAQSLCTLARNQLNDTGAPASVLASLLICLHTAVREMLPEVIKMHHYPPSATTASYQAWQKFQSPHHDTPGPSWAWRLLDPSSPSSYCASALTDSACALSVSDTLPSITVLVKIILTEMRAPLLHECFKRKPPSFQEISIGCKGTLIYTWKM